MTYIESTTEKRFDQKRFFDSNFYLIIISLVTLSYLAITEEWNGADLIRIMIIEILIVSFFVSIKYYLYPKNRFGLKMIYYLFSLFFIIPFVTLVLLIVGDIAQLDIRQSVLPFYSTLDSLESSLLLLYGLPFVYVKSLIELYTIPSILLLTKYTHETVHQYTLNRPYFFAAHNPTSYIGVVLRGLFVISILMLYKLISGNETIIDFPVLFFIFFYFLCDLHVHLNNYRGIDWKHG